MEVQQTSPTTNKFVQAYYIILSIGYSPMGCFASCGSIPLLKGDAIKKITTDGNVSAVTHQAITVTLEDRPNVRANSREATRYYRALQECKRINPETCTILLGKLVSVLPESYKRPNLTTFNEKEETERNPNVKLIKLFVFLFYIPELYRDITRQLNEEEFNNYALVMKTVTTALDNCPRSVLTSYKLNEPRGFSLWSRLEARLSNQPTGFFKGFCSCHRRRNDVQAQIRTNNRGGFLLQIKFQKTMKHRYLRVAKYNVPNLDNDEVILFPYFPYRVVERLLDKNRFVVEEDRSFNVKELELSQVELTTNP